MRALFLAVLLLASFLSLATAKKKNFPYEYGIMIDAGSTGSRLHIYQWEARYNASLPSVHLAPINQVTPWEEKTQPGIASFLSQPEQLRTYLAKLLDYAVDKIPSEQQATTPIYLFATAGMRLLNNTEQAKIMKVVEEVLAQSSFYFQNNFARVITGQFEGLFGWITVNYLKNTLSPGHSTGALDLGGASTQITFHTDESDTPSDYLMPITLGEDSYNVYVWSFLDYGLVQARSRLQQNLIANATSGATTIIDPCTPLGKNITYTLNSTTYTLQGRSNYSECYRALASLFQFSPCSYGEGHCSFNNVYQPKLLGDFLAMSGYYYTMDFFNLTSSNLEQLMVDAEAFCSLSWEELEKKYAGDSYLDQYCFNAGYIRTLLERGFGFEANGKEHHISYEAKVAGISIDWALGAMIYEANLLPIRHKGSLLGYILGGIVAGLAVIVLIVILIVVCGKKKEKTRFGGYDKL